MGARVGQTREHAKKLELSERIRTKTFATRRGVGGETPHLGCAGYSVYGVYPPAEGGGWADPGRGPYSWSPPFAISRDSD